MKLSASGYSNPIHSFEQRLAPNYAQREFRDPGLRMPHQASESGLGSLKTMPHLKPAIRMQAGGAPSISQLYAASRPNLYNPDPMERRVLLTGRQEAGQYFNPAFRAMPGSTMGFPYAEGGPAEDDAPDVEPGDVESGEEDSAAPPEELMEGDDSLSGPEQQEKQIVIEAMLALEGRHPDPRRALEAFVATFGQDALGELEEMMSQRPGQEREQEDEDEDEDEEGEEATPLAGGQNEPGSREDLEGAGGGLLSGPGDGQSDEIEGSTPSGRPVLLSDGEYVVDAPTVAALGSGSTNAGARRLDQMRKQVRKQAYGHEKQAKPMKDGGRTIMVELGG